MHLLAKIKYLVKSFLHWTIQKVCPQEFNTRIQNNNSTTKKVPNRELSIGMIKNRLVEIEIPESNPFANDKLDRKASASTFITMASMYAYSGCVVALNGEWGSGKTTFVKMTMQEMRNQGYRPLYFNAWENDFVSDPLVALLSEMKEIAPTSNKWDGVIANGGKIVTSMAGSILKSILKHKFGIDSETCSIGIDEATNLLKADLDEFANQKRTFQDFKDALSSYIADNTEEGKPVVFFVDELDRCNPNFAVKVLERIKHLFDIPNVVFVLSISKTQLEYAIQGYYGSEKIDSSNYLRRFIDVEFSLKKPDSEKYCQYLYDYYEFGMVFRNQQRLQYNEFQYDERNFNEMATTLIGVSNLDLRSIDKIFAHTRLALYGFSNNTYIITDVFFLLCYIKVMDFKFYSEIENHIYTAQQLLTRLEEYLPSTILVQGNDYDNTYRQMTFSIITLIHMYDRNANGIEYENIFRLKEGEKQKLECSVMNKDTFADAYKWKCERGGFRDTPLDHLIKKINLQESLLVS